MADAKISALPASTTPLAGTEVVPLVQSGTTKKVAVSDLTAGRSVATGQLTATSTTDSGVVAKGWSPVGGANSSNGTIQVGGVAAYSVRISFDATSGDNGIGYIDNTYNDSTSRLRARLRTDGTPINGWTLVPNGSTADLQINTGNLIQGTAAKGVNFTANTPAAGMTSQLLNWYEEGTWTPTIAGSGTSGTGTYTTQIGHYTRIGRTVHIQMTLTWTNLTGASGILVINGLPFASANVSGLATPVTTIADSVALTAGYFMQNFIFANSTQIAVRQFTSGNATAAAVGLATSGTIYVSGSYIV